MYKEQRGHAFTMPDPTIVAGVANAISGGHQIPIDR